MEIEIKILANPFYDKSLIDYAGDEVSGLDLVCPRNLVFRPEEVITIHTGIFINMQGNHQLMAVIAPIIGLDARGLVLVNPLATINKPYQGDVVIKLKNKWDESEMVVKAGDRIAQLIFLPTIKPQLRQVEQFSKSTKK